MHRQNSKQLSQQEQRQVYSSHEQQTHQTMQQQQQFSQMEHRTVTRQVTSQQRVLGGVVTQDHSQQLGAGGMSPPVFEQIFKNARFAQGGNALFEGRLRGNPKPVVSWTRKGLPMTESSKYRMSYNENTGDVSLLINQIGPGDEGEYTCTARNNYGEAICSVFIQPEGAPMPTMQSSLQKDHSFQTSQNKVDSQSYRFQQLTENSFTNGQIEIDLFH